MKKGCKVGCLSSFALMIVVGIIGSIFFPDAFEQESPPVKKEPILKELSLTERLFLGIEPVHAKKLIKEYKTNEFAADAKYKGNAIVVHGEIFDMHTTLGSHFLDLELLDGIMRVSCEMNKDELPKLQQLEKGQDVHVLGSVTGMTAGVMIDLTNCVFMLSKDYKKLEKLHKRK